MKESESRVLQHSAGQLAEWNPMGYSPGGRPTPSEPQVEYDGWFGESDSVLLSLAQEVGMADESAAVGHYLALRFAPPDAPLAAGALEEASVRRLTVHGARSITMTCTSGASGDGWAVKFRLDSPRPWASRFASQIRNGDQQVLAVVFAGPADFSEGCVTWAGVLSLD